MVDSEQHMNVLLQQQQQHLSNQLGLNYQPQAQQDLSLLANIALTNQNQTDVSSMYQPKPVQLGGLDVTTALLALLQANMNMGLLGNINVDMYKNALKAPSVKMLPEKQPLNKISLFDSQSQLNTLADVSSPRPSAPKEGGLHMSPKQSKFKTSTLDASKKWKEPLEELQKNRKRKLLKPKPTTKRPKTARTSQYRGIIWDKNSRAWRAKLSVNGKLEHVGLFDDEKEAALAWDQRALQVRGERTRLNFPASSLASATHGLDIQFKSKRIRKSQKTV
uniref:AP2/ERF domain-containing protein n=1 Tax=Aplanochytrium stocchinoi TaxID=215587 RepID=A0A7S3V163_9STRA|mmetsp:Transcript_15335/g.18987  ORF Transcript_15335/g.18987 Transcript_15335/m.18987 type:complete len:277 (+) Transcript_15335:153-983(+)|eukprot:CAMPEP_0204830526 /NCGR_PEP_ID=MMETSP1346-20131115/8773_1 /ASSEMBLY_ACC=CAM_ASM_000771 /TAXON_ID=215587 /ORGANISM="Aplanochytrium stocchinoi, Strain GSBS06" /LENGTH=276 /DNA_ID=CAMNT_0051960869 /DNA_START=229 /DNA_END=1059 /DNA_ORIENTATION=-